LLLISGSKIVAPGAVAGTFISAAMTRYIDSAVFGIATPEYSIVLITVLGFMVLITFAGSWVPAFRAIRTEPASLLH
jgi:ABC-type lipoprotein release transport system permease subunit